MAAGDVIVFEESKAVILSGGWEAADSIKIAILDNGTPPTPSDATPQLGDYSEVGAAGSYVVGGLVLDTWTTMVAEAAGVMTFDTGTNPNWAQNGSNDTDAFWGLVYNVTQAGNLAICYVELGGPVDMSAGDLTITWNASGIFTIT